MSLVKGKQEFRTILDFSSGKISKNKITQALRQVEVLEVVRHDNEAYIFVENDIIVGMYQIRLSFGSVDSSKFRTRLKEYGGFRVAIYERHRKGNVLQNINLACDKRFASQYWVGLNDSYNVRMTNLVDIIMFLNRVNNLKIFL